MTDALRGFTVAVLSACAVAAIAFTGGCGGNGSVSVWHVDFDATGANDGTSWENAFDGFQGLQSALAAAKSGDEIWVAEGMYKPTSGFDQTISFALVDGVAVYGGFAGAEAARAERDWAAHETILWGDIGMVGLDADNSYHVVVGASNATLDGFTVTGGHAFGLGPDWNGAGMYNDGLTGLTVANCEFWGNTAGVYGGGMCNSNSSPTIINCTFSGNVALNGQGGGIYNSSSSAIVENCTFSGNSAFADGGGVCNFDGSSLAITNSILWGDTAGASGPEVYNDGSSSCTVAYSDAQGCGGSGAGWGASFGTDGGGNIDSDPAFVDADGTDDTAGTADDDLHLSAGSPCIDAADGDAAPATDIEGNERYDDPNTDPNTGAGSLDYADMGAYEYQGP